MIAFEKGTFHLSTQATSYLFRILPTGQLENLHYGTKIAGKDDTAKRAKITAGTGSTVAYHPEDKLFSLDLVPLEYSGVGRGDYRHTPLEVKMPDGTFVTDFVYTSHSVEPGPGRCDTLPVADGGADECETLTVILKDKKLEVYLDLVYTVFPETNVIARRTRLRNGEENPLVIRKIMSMMLDLPESDYDLVTFDGGWVKETHKHVRQLSYGIYVNDSTTGASSNRHNPGILLARKGCGEEYGECLGVNLVYSGNHYEAAEVSNHDLLRVMTGINPFCFEWQLTQGETFETPQAVLTWSSGGFNGAGKNFHGFINRHIVRGKGKGEERPVLFNNWEATFFDFTRRKLLKLARGAKRLGAELFVLDDGWFGKRNSDTAGLGDYAENRRKLGGSLAALSKKIGRMGMKFGLWFEPEMMNTDSDLYRQHPEYAVRIPGREPLLGRNQLVLDLCNPKVRDYVADNVNRVLSGAGVAYVKWDMNRHMSDFYSACVQNQGEFFHRYLLGLYEVLGRVVRANPDVLFESCSSGGNRFDLGMLCYMPQVWASDDTDPVERLEIQGGLTHLYPLSCIGAHVSQSPHQQTLRRTPLSTRFNVAAFGVLGYELDLAELTRAEKREIRDQIEFYKRHRRTFQYGNFTRLPSGRGNRVRWEVSSENVAVLGDFQTLASASPGFDVLRFSGVEPCAGYRVRTKPQTLSIKTFGGLLKHVLPVKLKPEGFLVRTADRLYRLPDAVEEYRCGGDLLRSGFKPYQQFMGTWYNSRIRLLGDFGSQLYTAEKIIGEEKSNGTNSVCEGSL